MGGKRKAGLRTPGVACSDVAWQVDVAPLPQPKNRKEEISVGLIEVLAATWRDAVLEATDEIGRISDAARASALPRSVRP